jgi:tocopherol O-methyltransferase
MSTTLTQDRRGLTKRAIRQHYDWATPFYRLFWGPHIHHGLWDGDESPDRAQRQLTDYLAAEADIPCGARVLDVGCGMGGSAVRLAEALACRVTGLTLSPVQRNWATAAAWLRGLRRRVRFVCQDVEQAEFPPATFDVVWSVECTEHLFDKPGFFRRAARWLRPGGRVAICAWLAGDRPHSEETSRQVRAVCQGFLCPSLGTADDYLGWMRDAGLEPCHHADLTDQVARTWEICSRRVRRSRVRWLARYAGQEMVEFLDHFEVIREAYRGGAMKYGCFVARGR